MNSSEKLFLVPKYDREGRLVKNVPFKLLKVEPASARIPLPKRVLVEGRRNKTAPQALLHWLQHHLNPHPYMDARRKSLQAPARIQKVEWPDGTFSWASWSSMGDAYDKRIAVYLSGPCSCYTQIVLERAA
jgi:hypothetical protein